MIIPARVPIVMPSRWLQFGGSIGDFDIDYLGVDLTNAISWVFQVQYHPGTPYGGHIFQMFAGLPGTQGISASYLPELVTDAGLMVGGTRVRGQIDDPVAGLPVWNWGQTPPDEPLELVYEVTVERPGVAEQLLFFGPFTVLPGVAVT